MRARGGLVLRGSIPESSEGGFTLVEVLVAMVVAVAAVSILAQGFSTGARASNVSQNATRAALLGQRVITDLETGELTLNQGHSGKFDEEPDFSYETKSDSRETGLYEITVTIQWKERNDDRKLTLVRLMREKGKAP